MADIVTVEKGQRITLYPVNDVKEWPSKNRDWQSRWAMTGYALDGSEVTIYVGDKAMQQQCSRRGMRPPDLRMGGKLWTFERTAEGYWNILAEGEVFKSQTLLRADKSKVPSGKGSPPKSPNSFPEEDSDSPPDEPMDAEEAEEYAAELERQRRFVRHAKVEEDLQWAYSLAYQMVRQSIDTDIPMHQDTLRAVVALAATIHITDKGMPRA